MHLFTRIALISAALALPACDGDLPLGNPDDINDAPALPPPPPAPPKCEPDCDSSLCIPCPEEK